MNVVCDNTYSEKFTIELSLLKLLNKKLINVIQKQLYKC